MKTLISFALLFCSVAHAGIIDSNMQLTNMYSNVYELLVYQTENQSDYTGVFFSVNGSTLSFFDSYMDEGSDWYVIQPDTIFDANTINDYSSSYLIKTTEDGMFTQNLSVGFGDFYLGVNTGNENGFGWPPRNIYGYAQLNNNNGVISMVTNTMNYDNNTPMIMTTFQAVPEPSTIVLVIIGMILFAVKVYVVRV